VPLWPWQIPPNWGLKPSRRDRKPATNRLWEAGSRSASQEILVLYGIQMFITSVTWERQWSLLWARRPIISR
jgi:hypothetical protein